MGVLLEADAAVILAPSFAASDGVVAVVLPSVADIEALPTPVLHALRH